MIEEYEVGQKIREIKDLLSFLLKNITTNETHKHIFCFKLTSIDEKRYSNDRIARYLYKNESSYNPDIIPTEKVTEIKKTVTFVDLVVNRQIYFFLCTLICTVFYKLQVI